MSNYRKTMHAAIPSVLLWTAVAGPAAVASQVTWTYTGNETTNCQYGPCTTPGLLTDSLTASITFSSPLSDNLSSANLSVNIVSWTITDKLGYIDLTSSADTLNAAIFSTNSSGQIVDFYNFSASEPSYPGTAGSTAAAIQSLSNNGDAIAIIQPNLALEAGSALTEGKWSSAPEPSTAALALLGGAILLIAMRRKRSNRLAAQTAR